MRATDPEAVDPAALLGVLPDLLALCSADGVITWVRSGQPAPFGWQPQDLVGRWIFDLFAKDANHEVHVESLAEVMSAPGLHGPIEVTVLAADGTLGELELMVTNALDDPAVGAIVASGRDITGRDTKLEALRRREAWASAIVRGFSDLVLILIPCVLFLQHFISL